MLVNERSYIYFSIVVSFVVYVALATINVSFRVPGFNYIVVVVLAFLTLIGIIFFDKIKLSSLLFLLVFSTLGCMGYFASTIDVGAMFSFFYLLLVSTMIILIRWVKPSEDEIIKVVTLCFYMYLVMSIFTFFVYKSHYREFSFNGLILERAFHGIEGSPANIDTFTTLFFLMVIFSSSMKRMVKVGHAMVCIGIVYFCDTQTPLLIIITWAGYLLVNLIFRDFSRRIIIAGMYLVMLLVFYLSLNNKFFYDVLIFITNGRNYIWNEQIINVFSDLSLVDIWFGDFTNAYVAIHWSEDDTNNPHNGYIFLLIRLGLVVTSIFLAYVFYISKHLNQLQYFILISLLAASVSNSNVFYLSNPIITFLLVYSFLPKMRSRN